MEQSCSAEALGSEKISGFLNHLNVCQVSKTDSISNICNFGYSNFLSQFCFRNNFKIAFRLLDRHSDGRNSLAGVSYISVCHLVFC